MGLQRRAGYRSLVLRTLSTATSVRIPYYIIWYTVGSEASAEGRVLCDAAPKADTCYERLSMGDHKQSGGTMRLRHTLIGAALSAVGAGAILLSPIAVAYADSPAGGYPPGTHHMWNGLEILVWLILAAVVIVAAALLVGPALLLGKARDSRRERQELESIHREEEYIRELEERERERRAESRPAEDHEKAGG